MSKEILANQTREESETNKIDESLEKKLKIEMEKLEVSEDNQESLVRYLGWIKKKDRPTYEHSLRVGLAGVKVAEVLNLDPKALFYSGLLHDLGKVLIDPELLKKQGRFSSEDMEKMKDHSIYGYYLLRRVHYFSAQILLRHHRFGEKEYPERLPEPEVTYNEETNKLIEKYAKILSIIDYYDAASTREDRAGEGKLTKAEVYQMLAETYPDERILIDELYKAGVFK